MPRENDKGMNNPLDKWKGEFGDEYDARNTLTPELVEARTNLWASIFTALGDVPETILEIGAGNGQNLMAIGNAIHIMMDRTKRQTLKSELYAVEPNGQARISISAHAPYVNLQNGDIYDLPFDKASIQFVFTSGVLIHIPPDQLDKAMGEMYRVSSKYIFCAEYFAPECEEVKYRDEKGMLWRNDFGGLFLDKYKLRVIGYGFCWKRLTKLDNLTWWLMEKVH